MEDDSIKVVIKIDGNEFELGLSLVGKDFIDGWESIKINVPAILFGKIISYQSKKHEQETN